MIDDETSPSWRKSRFCDSGACVEVAVTGGEVAIRDSKTSDGPILRFSRSEWDAFVAGVEAGDFQLN